MEVVMTDIVDITTKYPEEVSAANLQNIPLSKVFAKLQDINNDGVMDTAGYPLIKLNAEGEIPMFNGKIVFDIGRLSAAKAYAVKNHESDDVLDLINSAKASMNAMKLIDANANGIPDFMEIKSISNGVIPF